MKVRVMGVKVRVLGSENQRFGVGGQTWKSLRQQHLKRGRVEAKVGKNGKIMKMIGEAGVIAGAD